MKILFMTTFLLLISAIAPLKANENALGDWTGELSTPQGNLPLIVTIMEDETGALKAELESPAQAPGQKIPISSISIEGDTLSFTIQALGASYTGTWDDNGDQWVGTFKQGMDFPLVLKRGLPDAKPVIEGMDGAWEGTLTMNNANFRLILRVTTGDQGTVPTLDSPDFGAQGLAVTEFTKESETVRFTVPAAGAKYEGILSDDNTLSGTWAQPGQPDAQVTFVRTKKTTERTKPKRPQTPKEPFGYNVEEVEFENKMAEGVKLAGTLTLPEGTGPFPAAILISGSGPQDRNETILGHKPFFVLADFLTQNGIAVLRYDDRGFGASTGNFSGATSEDFASDANAAVTYLMTRPEINNNAIGLIGHSEGGMIAPISSVNNKDIGYIVMLAGPGTNLDQLMLSQNRLVGASQGVSKETLDRNEQFFVKIFSAIKTSKNTEELTAKITQILTPEALAALGVPETQKDQLLKTFTSPWYQYFLKHEPKAFLSRVKVPVLAINGALDQQVPADENLAAIEAALANHPDATIQKLEGLNHLFQTAETGGIGEYNIIEETFAPSALELVANWINARF